MADEIPGTEPAASPESSAPVESAPSAETPSTPEPSPATFGENLTAELAETSPTSFSQADLDGKLAEAKTQWETHNPYGWAKDYKPEEIQTWREAIEGARANPVETATQLLAAALATPQHKQAALSFAARLLGGHVGQAQSSQPAPPAVDQEPGPDIPAVDVNGKTVMLYSAEQLARREAWKDKQLDAKLGERFKPFEQERETAKQAAERAEYTARANAFAVDVFTRMQKRPGFTENQPAIYEAWQKLQGNDDPLTARENLHEAYAQVVYGKLSAATSAAATADSNRRAAANTGRVITSQPTHASASAPSFATRLADEMSKSRKSG